VLSAGSCWCTWQGISELIGPIEGSGAPFLGAPLRDGLLLRRIARGCR
jgi:hypothetical protein